jgi:glycosyltransferase involved in cell wall biosynthesis
MPKISLIIPTFRRYQLLTEALRSVQEQTFQDFEVIVVDDHSEDNGETEKIVKMLNDSRFQYVYLDANVGPAGARNKALPFCTGEYLSFLDSDDLLSRRKFEVQTVLLDNNPDVAMIYSDGNVIYSNGTMVEKVHQLRRKSPLPSGYIAQDFIQDNFIGTMTVTLRKSIFEEMSGFDENMLLNEDDDLWFRIMMKYKVLFSEYVAGTRKLHHANLSWDRTKMLECQIACISKYIADYPGFMIMNRPMIEWRIWRLVKSYLMRELKLLKIPQWSVLKETFKVYRQLRHLKIS